jgi:hypothetical protein
VQLAVSEVSSMLRSLLVNLGLRKAPTPVRNYVAASSLFGAMPVAAFFAWKYRDALKHGVQRLSRMPVAEG